MTINHAIFCNKTAFIVARLLIFDWVGSITVCRHQAKNTITYLVIGCVSHLIVLSEHKRGILKIKEIVSSLCTSNKQTDWFVGHWPPAFRLVHLLLILDVCWNGVFSGRLHVPLVSPHRFKKKNNGALISLMSKISESFLPSGRLLQVCPQVCWVSFFLERYNSKCVTEKRCKIYR